MHCGALLPSNYIVCTYVCVSACLSPLDPSEAEDKVQCQSPRGEPSGLGSGEEDSRAGPSGLLHWSKVSTSVCPRLSVWVHR